MDSTHLHKVSTIVIDDNGSTHVFKSLDEVPEHLREKLNQSVSDGRAATLLIADEGGRREILRKLEGEDSSIESAVLSALAEQRKKWRPDSTSSHSWQTARTLFEVALIGCLGLAIWMLLADR
jgi:hypothetical protein